MDQAKFAELLDESRFSPFVVTLLDGFSLAIGAEERKHLLIGKLIADVRVPRASVVLRASHLVRAGRGASQVHPPRRTDHSLIPNERSVNQGRE